MNALIPVLKNPNEHSKCVSPRENLEGIPRITQILTVMAIDPVDFIDEATSGLGCHRACESSGDIPQIASLGIAIIKNVCTRIGCVVRYDWTRQPSSSRKGKGKQGRENPPLIPFSCANACKAAMTLLKPLSAYTSST